MKRIFDVIFPLIIILITLPFILPALLVVFAITGDSQLFIQAGNVALNKQTIRIIKIRTIKNSASFKELEKRSGRAFNKREYESYVPKFCRYLRKSGIDELPQLLNALKGEMSLVGPRPFNKQDLLIMKMRSRCFMKEEAGNIRLLAGIWR